MKTVNSEDASESPDGVTPSPSLTVDEFVNQIDIRIARGMSLADIGRPLAASRQSVLAWRTRKTRPNRATLMLAEYVWTYGKLPEARDNLGWLAKLSGGRGERDG